MNESDAALGRGAGKVLTRGHLNPGDAEVVIHRFIPGGEVAALVRQVWLVHWDVPTGQVRPQRLLPFPACNAVFEPGRCALYGPPRRAGVRDLRGKAWAFGLLLRPAATPLFTTEDPAALPEGGAPLPGAPLGEATRLMDACGRDWAKAERAIAALLTTWLAPLASKVDDAGRLADAACELAEDDPSVTRVDHLAARLQVNVRRLGRAVRAHCGVSPKWLIECRRLQEAGLRLSGDPSADLAALALELGYADQAHFTRRYKEVMGETPDATRRRDGPR